MKKQLFALAAAAALAAPMLAQAQDTGSWIVRARALHLDSSNGGSAQNAVPGLAVENKTFPEVDITYFFTPNLAAELVLTYPQKHDVTSAAGAVGTVKHLPPTLSLQYHFTGLQGFRPYVGAGLNYTRFSGIHLANDTVTLDKNSYGLAIGAGVDVPLSGGWLLNVDIKKVQIRTDVKTTAGATVGDLKIDPTLFSVGVGYRF